MAKHKEYQDIWIKGETIKKGNRECQSRYECVKNYLLQYQGENLKVLDFGANNGYFGIRIASEFPEFQVYLVDCNKKLKRIIEKNELNNVRLVSQYMSEEKLIYFDIKNKFDIVLLLSVLHHYKNPEKVIDYFTKKDDKTLFEIGYPDEKNPYRQEVMKRAYDYLLTKNPIQINKWIAHDRPIFYTNQDTKIIKGVIHAGAGTAKTNSLFTKNFLFKQFNHEFYPGTLNVKLEGNTFFIHEKMCIMDEEIYTACYRAYPAKLNGVRAYILLTEDKGRITKEIEIIGGYKFRDLFNYADGDTIEIAIDQRYIK